MICRLLISMERQTPRSVCEANTASMRIVEFQRNRTTKELDVLTATVCQVKSMLLLLPVPPKELVDTQ